MQIRNLLSNDIAFDIEIIFEKFNNNKSFQKIANDNALKDYTKTVNFQCSKLILLYKNEMFTKNIDLLNEQRPTV